MSVSSSQLVSVHIPKTVQPQSTENRSAPSPPPPANSNAPALVSKSTASIQISTRLRSFVSKLPQESPLRVLLEQLTALELQAMILNLLLGNKDEDNSSFEKLLAMALLGLILENRDPRFTLLDGKGSAGVRFNQIAMQNAITAYTETRLMPEIATAGSTGTEATPSAPKIDTTA